MLLEQDIDLIFLSKYRPLYFWTRYRFLSFCSKYRPPYFWTRYRFLSFCLKYRPPYFWTRYEPFLRSLKMLNIITDYKMVPPLSALSVTGTSGCGFKMVPPKGKKCARTPSLERASKAINMHSRRPTEQCFYFLEPSHGCL